MRDAFARGVGMPRPQDHRDGTEQIRHRGDKPGLRVAEAERLDDLRQPELHAIERADESEIDQAQRDHFWRRQRLPQRQMFCRLLGGDFTLELCGKPGLLLRRQPNSLRWPLGEIETPLTSAINAEMMPQVTMIRAIQRLAPNFSSARLLGTSKMK